MLGDFSSVQRFSTYVHKVPSSEYYPQTLQQFQGHWFHISRERNQVPSIFPGAEKVKAFFNLCDNKLTAIYLKWYFLQLIYPFPKSQLKQPEVHFSGRRHNIALHQLCLLSKVPIDDDLKKKKSLTKERRDGVYGHKGQGTTVKKKLSNIWK